MLGIAAVPASGATTPLAGPQPEHELSLMATIAHELRGPLTALATSSELLAEDFLQLEPERVKGMLDAMRRRTLWLQGLVENLLCAATIREGRLSLYRQSLDLTDLLADVEAVVGPLLAQHGQPLRLRLSSQVPALMGDRRRLGQVLINLILNASKFSAPNTPIDVTSSLRNGYVWIGVSDRGPGVPADEAERIFELYYRAPTTAATNKDGVGLGLSIVRSVVEAHGGQVTVESRRGGGARFVFSIPAAEFSAPAKPRLDIAS